MESKLLYIFKDLAKENNIAIRNSFRFFITVLQIRKRKENDTLKIRLEFFPQIWKAEYANWDRLVRRRGKEIGFKSPDLDVRGKSPDLGVGVKSLLCLMCVNEQSVLYMLGVFHRF